MKGSPFFVWVLGLVSTQCALNVGRGHGCFILCYRPYVRPRLQCSWAYIRLRVLICSERGTEGSTLHFVSVSVCGYR